MSLEGFVICKCREAYGVEISREEAGRMIADQRNGTVQNIEYSNTNAKKRVTHNKDRYVPARHDKLYSH
jgi:hypothetical protein